MPKQSTTAGGTIASRRPYISLRELWERTDVPDRFKEEVSRVIHGDGYGSVSRACRRALDLAGIGSVTLWEPPS